MNKASDDYERKCKKEQEEDSPPIDASFTIELDDPQKDDSSESVEEDYQIHKPGVRYPTVLRTIGGYNIKPEQVIEPNAEAFAVPKMFYFFCFDWYFPL